jgi:predicted heme/steroid binding protein
LLHNFGKPSNGLQTSTCLKGFFMGIPAQTINANQLKKYNGEDEDRMYIAYKGIVYDVTDCPKWRQGIHEGLHLPGQDLSFELDNGAPHAGGVFSHPCIKVVGRLDPFEDK